MKLNVANKSCIRRIGFRHMKSAPARNLIAILAIALTSVLFTAIFTIASSIVYNFQMSNFRQAGGWPHGSFKSLTAEDVEILKDDPLIRQYGVRHFLGQAMNESFNKSQVEVSYKDAQEAAFSFVEPKEGRLPKEGSNEAATDTRVLSLLGVPVKLGEEFTLTIGVDGIETTETFTLCGYWEYDDAMLSNDVLLPESRVNEILEKLDIPYSNGYSGMYFLDVMFKNSLNIEDNLITVLENHGYEHGDSVGQRDEKGNFLISLGVNWGYLNAQFGNSVDPITVVSLVLVLLIIVFTGYLIIYNVFQISVSNDIRFYGLLKTIGTTGKQLKRIVLMQAALLSAIGIPVGLIAGCGIGALMLPVTLSITDLKNVDFSVNPLIFVISTLFSLVTVVISCRKPGRMAAKVSPIEAVRYSEGTSPSKKIRRTRKGASVAGMAFANLGRSRKRTAVTMLSLTLAVLLLNITVTFTSGFDMEKYVSRKSITDFHVASASYYSAATRYTDNIPVPESLIEQIQAQGGVTDGGRTYGRMGYSLVAATTVPEEHFRKMHSLDLAQMRDETERETFITGFRNEDGQLTDSTRLYGMDPFCLDQLKVMDGDISKLYGGGNYTAAVYHEDDYGNPELDTHWAQVGDTVTIRYEEYEWYNPDTGEIVENPIDSLRQNNPVESRILEFHDEEYEIVATVTVPTTMTYRSFGTSDYILNSETFKKDTGTDTVMYYAFDMEEEAIPAMEQFLTDYTNGAGSQFNFESRQRKIDDFSALQNMFLLAGSALSFIVGLIGVLNFLNTILTGILTRHREFAVLQSIGMTGKQLKGMLVTEGILYTVLTVLFSFVLIVVTAPFIADILNATFWFFTYRFTALPAIALMPFLLLLGVLAPLITYRFASGKSIVERLREAE